MTNNFQISTKHRIFSYIIFIIAFSSVAISLVSFVFPALIERLTSPIKESPVNPLEPGLWAYPLLITDLVVFGLTVLYYKKKFPQKTYTFIRSVLSFDFSQRIALVVVAILIAIFIVASISHLTTEELWADYTAGVKQSAETEGFQYFMHNPLAFRILLLHESLVFFGNARIIPFITSISLLLLTYFFTTEITRKRLSGIIALAIVLQSNLFFEYSSSAAYDNVWTFFYLLSIYLIHKRWWFLSSISYILSVFAKELTIIFLPMTLLFIYGSDLPIRKKILNFIPYLIVVILIVIIANRPEFQITSTYTGFNVYDFIDGFTSLSFQMRFDGFVIVLLLPLTVGLFISSKNGLRYADAVLVLIAGILLSAPFLNGFTFYTVQPYRFVPLVVFFAMGAGILFSKRPAMQV